MSTTDLYATVVAITEADHRWRFAGAHRGLRPDAEAVVLLLNAQNERQAFSARTTVAEWTALIERLVARGDWPLVSCGLETPQLVIPAREVQVRPHADPGAIRLLVAGYSYVGHVGASKKTSLVLSQLSSRLRVARGEAGGLTDLGALVHRVTIPTVRSQRLTGAREAAAVVGCV